MSSKRRTVIQAITPPVLFSVYHKLRPAPPKKTGPTIPEDAHRRIVGGEWDEIGKLQFDFLVQEGLQPAHRLLDVGCGSLRGGVHFIRYLEDGHYYGIDRQQWLLDAAVNVELPRAGLADRTVHLSCREDFDFTSFGLLFDYALAQSVFSHLPWNSILRCLVNVQRVLKPGGQFYATFFEDRDGAHTLAPIYHEIGGKTTYSDQDPYHYPFDVFEELARRTHLDVTYIGAWNHPRDQMMMVFTQPG
jgi:SAM-dependent methyltransferase